eukprot:ANDGO_06421.mRNA.1 hypothetical protein DFA_05698
MRDLASIALPQSIDGNIPTKAWQARGCITWAKTIIISELVDKDATIAELVCGVGLEWGKWIRASAKFLYMIDM